jgi:P27 family predicted phage terminase small subunit
LLEGVPGHAKPVNKHEPQFDKGHLTAPDWLSELAREEWARIGPELEKLGLLTTGDYMAFAVYCQSVGFFKEAAVALEVEPKVCPGGRTTNSAIQWHRILNEAKRNILVFGGRFGLTPSDRTELKSMDLEPESDLKKFLRRKRENQGVARHENGE